MTALRELRAEARARNADLGEDDADDLAEELGGEAVARVLARIRGRTPERSADRGDRESKTITVSATEAKNRLGALLSELDNGTAAIVIEHHGRPRAVLVAAEDWAALVAARERVRRQEAWDQLWRLAAAGSARNADLTQEEADALAEELGEEAKRRVASRLSRQ
jgi:prevent-host-death family protein